MSSKLEKLWCLVPNYSCAICYSIFSLWGFVILIVVGLGLSAEYRKVDYETLKDDEVSDTALQTYIAAGIYLACMLGCGARWAYLHVQQRNLQKQKLMRQMQSAEEV